MDFTDDFDRRLAALHKAPRRPRGDIDAAVLAFERLKTALAICTSLFKEPPDQATVVAVFSELCAAGRNGQGSNVAE